MHAPTSPSSSPTHGSSGRPSRPRSTALEIQATVPAAAEAVDVILRDGGTLRLRPPATEDGRRRAALLRRALRAEPLPALPRLRPPRHAGSSPRSSTPTGPSGARSSAVSSTPAATNGSSRSRATRGCATWRRPRSHSPSPTTSTDAGSARACSSSSRSAPGEAGITSFVAERAHRQPGRARAVHRGGVRARAQHARTARSSCGSRSRRPPATRPASTRATTPRCRPRCARSSARRRSPSIGASRRRGTIGGELFRNILTGDFAGAVYPVNLRARARRRRPRVAVARGDPRRDRPRRDLRPGRAGARRGASPRSAAACARCA